MDDGDAERLRRPDAVDVDLPAVDENLALVGDVDAAEDFDEGGFPRAVLAHDGMDFAFPEFEINALEGVHAGKALVDAFHFEECVGHWVRPFRKALYSRE